MRRGTLDHSHFAREMMSFGLALMRGGHSVRCTSCVPVE
ncbi:hypothetical protein EJ067_33830 [Mesorhizobium sp. M1D.F.Ca.ET.043.01.1.1]|nr:hypothetical protein EJ067_33830 [Mesorhizobium sp. M1D.F.Ca.ET.043.01.1.1]